VPVDYVYDKQGTMVRDPKTDKPLREPNYAEPVFVQKQEYASRMQLIVLVVDALAEDPAVTWDNDAARDTKEFYIACFEEMKASGITLGDMRLIRDEAQVLGNLNARALEKAAESF